MKLRTIASSALPWLLASTALVSHPSTSYSQKQRQLDWSPAEKPIVDLISRLRSLPGDVRARETKDLALRIREMPAAPNKVRLAYGLATLSTEGDFGHDTLQEVATTLAGALREWPIQGKPDEPPRAYVELAELVRYEYVDASLDDPEFTAAVSKIKEDNTRRQQADFTLRDLSGKRWTLKEMKGSVVLLNFWATWCPPCRKEMPDLDALYRQFKDQGLVILAISDEDAGKVRPFIDQEKINYPILLDPGGAVGKRFEIAGIPKTFVYDRDGKIVAQSIDMRTRRQFLEMLAQAGLR
jgi:peroxiredoxin